jgi:hypothetical protein
MLLLLIHETIWNNSCLHRTDFVQIFLLPNVTENLRNCLLVTKQLILKQFYGHSEVCGHHFMNSGQLVSRFLTTDTCPRVGSSQTVLTSISASLKPSKDTHKRQITSCIICFCGYFPEFETKFDVCSLPHDDKEKKTIHTWRC